MRSNNQHGFGLIEVLVIVMVVGLLSGAGYYAYNSQKTKPVKSSTVTKQDTNDAGKTDVLEIPEWGIKLKLAGLVDTPYYVMRTHPDGVSMSLGARSRDKYPNCRAEEGGFGGVVRKKNGEEYSYGPDRVVVNDENVKDQPQYKTKIGEYHYFINMGFDTCAYKDGREQESAGQADIDEDTAVYQAFNDAKIEENQ